jgi:hypothetical protein
MIKRTCLINLFIFLLLTTFAFAGESPYNPNDTRPRYIFCRLTDAPAHATYFSGIFLLNQKDLYPIQDAYLHFVAQKYAYKIVPGVDRYNMPVQCTAFPDSKQTKLSRDAQAENEAYKAYKAIQTEWTYGSQKPVEESSPASSTSSQASPQQDEKIDPYNMALLQQDPRGLNLSPLDRQFVLSEAPKAKSYCVKDPQLSQNLDCTCFVRTVFNYRIAHASGPIQTTNFPPLASILTKPDFICSECVKGGNHNAVACDHANH